MPATPTATASPTGLDAPTAAAALTIVEEQKVSDTAGGFTATFAGSDDFGSGVAPVGDLDGDGIVDLVVGASDDNDGAGGAGAVYVLFMNADGTVASHQKISNTSGGLGATLAAVDSFGSAVAGLGDLDGDGIGDVVVGADQDDTGGGSNGAVYVLLLNADGTVKAEQKIAEGLGGLAENLNNNSRFGSGVTGLGDLDGDGINDVAVGASGDDTNGSFTGAVYVLFLNADGSVKAEQKITHGTGGLTATIAADDTISSVAGIGDLDGDGVEDLVMGAYATDDGGTNRGAIHVLFLNTDGTVKGEQKISDTTGGLTATLDDSDFFGISIGALGDYDADGAPDIAVGATWDDDGGTNAGTIYLLGLNTDGTVKTEQKVTEGVGGFAGPLDTFDLFGGSVTGIGDLDGDGAINLVVGATSDDDGASNNGAIYVLDLVSSLDTDGDGLYDAWETAYGDTDGDTNPNWNDADDDGDGTPTASENADPNGDGDPRDARDTDRDGQPDWLDAPTDPTEATVVAEQKISSTQGGLTGPLDNFDFFGSMVSPIGDLDGDGVNDIAVGVFNDDDGGTDRGAVYILFLNADGTVKAEQKISDTTGGLATALDDSDWFGEAVAGAGDVDGDGIGDVAVGLSGDDDGGTDRGAVFILFLNADGTVKAEQKISDTSGGLTATLDNDDFFGRSVDGVGDVDGDGIVDIVVGADGDDDGGSGRGAVYVLFLNADGTVKAEQKISDTTGGLATALDDSDSFGEAVAGAGDVDGDGIGDVAVGLYGDDDGGTDRGAVYVLLLNANGTVKAEQKISDTSGGLTATLDDSDWFGGSLAPLGDVDGDGTVDLIVGAPGDDDGGSNRGAAHVLFLNSDGTVKAEGKISDTAGGLTTVLDDGDWFGISVAGLGDLDGDGTVDLGISAVYDDDGGTNRGAIYILDLTALSCTTDADADGLYDCWEDANTDADDDPSTNPGPRHRRRHDPQLPGCRRRRRRHPHHQRERGSQR